MIDAWSEGDDMAFYYAGVVYVGKEEVHKAIGYARECEKTLQEEMSGDVDKIRVLAHVHMRLNEIVAMYNGTYRE